MNGLLIGISIILLTIILISIIYLLGRFATYIFELDSETIEDYIIHGIITFLVLVIGIILLIIF